MNKDKLIEELKAAAQAYYHDGEALMSDELYDSKLELLEKSLVEEDYNNKEIMALIESPSAGTLPARNLVRHKHPMLSLAKARNEDELMTYFKRASEAGAEGYSIQAKLDGIAASVLYKDGVLTQIVTRGDGKQGEDMTYIVNCKDLCVLGLPMNINVMGEIELRGEVFARHSQFDIFNKNRLEALGESFSNSRNAVSGILTRAERGLGYEAEITFATYSVWSGAEPLYGDVVRNENVILVDDLTTHEIESIGEAFPTHNIKCEDNLMRSIVKFGEARDTLDIPTDGAVIKPMNEVEMFKSMGLTSHHPIAFIAYKYPGVRELTTVEEITVTVGKTGRLTPNARVTPVEVDGVIITNLTCHNFSWLHEMGIRVGSHVEVTRANDVIPAIAKVVYEGPNEVMPVPTHCPSCGETLVGDGTELPKTLNCVNNNCPSRTLFFLKSVVGRQYLHIDGMGDVFLNALVEEHPVEDIIDIFSLTSEDLQHLKIGVTSTGNDKLLGKLTADKIIASIAYAKENTPSNRLLASMNIAGVGPNTSQRIIEHFSGLHNFLNADMDELQGVDGVGETVINTFHNNIDRIREMMYTLSKMGVHINDELKSHEVAVGTFSVSGSVEGFANRDEFVKHMQTLGWEFHRSPKVDTDILFADPNGTSSKIKKARDNGTRIIDKLSDL